MRRARLGIRSPTQLHAPIPPPFSAPTPTTTTSAASPVLHINPSVIIVNRSVGPLNKRSHRRRRHHDTNHIIACPSPNLFRPSQTPPPPSSSSPWPPRRARGSHRCHPTTRPHAPAEPPPRTWTARCSRPPRRSPTTSSWRSRPARASARRRSSSWLRSC